MNIPTDAKKSWETYCSSELACIRPILLRHGFTLDEVQPHISGERYLMHAVTTTSGKKLILLGTNALGEKVVIKATRDSAGTRELEHERMCRQVLKKINFAREVFHTPEEIAFFSENGFVITAQYFINQTCSFLERPLEEQFSLALRAFKGQEGAHATTFKHRKLIAGTFGMRDSDMYLDTFSSFVENVSNVLQRTGDARELLLRASCVLAEGKGHIEQYTGFLTHTDFVPHNIRIKDDTMYLLDHSSLTFGNKYEGWARFINFMTLYNPPLQRALEEYVRNNRTSEESVSLRLMRIYRLGEIIWYYGQTLEKSTGPLLELNTLRIQFWKEVLSCVLKNEEIPLGTVEIYRKRRDTLRSDEEKQRQQGLH